MKNVLPLVALVLVAAMFTSCKKEYSCMCTYTDPYGTHTKEGANIKGTKSQAKSVCNTVEKNYKATYGYSGVSCNL